MVRVVIMLGWSCDHWIKLSFYLPSPSQSKETHLQKKSKILQTASINIKFLITAWFLSPLPQILINSNSKLCNYNTSAEIQILWCPRGEQARMWLRLHSALPESRETMPWRGHTSRKHRLFFFLPLYRGDGARADSWRPGRLMPLSEGLGQAVACQVIFGQAPPHTEPSGASFSQWPKWPLIYLQECELTLPWK